MLTLRRINHFELLLILLLASCGGGSPGPRNGILVQGSVNEGVVSHALLSWTTSDGSFLANGVADADGKWEVFVPFGSLNPGQMLIVSATNPENRQMIRSVVAIDDLLGSSGRFASDLTTVSHFTEAVFRLAGLDNGFDRSKLDMAKRLIHVGAGGPVPTGYPFVDHFSSAIRKRFDDNDAVPRQEVAPAEDPFWQVWADNGTRSDPDAFRTDCAGCHAQPFCVGCHSAGDVYTPEKFADAVSDAHWTGFHVTHPVSDRSQLNRCVECHENVFCTGCHQGVALADNTTSHSWSPSHAREARGNLPSCRSCHAGGETCLRCHSAITGLKVDPHPSEWSALAARLNGPVCARCH